MKRLGRMALLAALLGGAGCYKATFIRDASAVKAEEHDKWLDYWLWGLVNEQDIDVKQFCPDGRVAQVVTGGNFGSGIVTALTLGIYAPRKVYVTCASGGRALQLELDERGKLVAFAEVKR
jgi:hypothetical protein